MSKEMRVGFDGSQEEVVFEDIDYLKLADPDPFQGSRIRYVERLGLDGLELVPMRVIEPYGVNSQAAILMTRGIESIVRSKSVEREEAG